ncbi:MAG: hypothetical protein GF383_08290 [Candidatus Lokiarchaeota archaeon]|nr:hypothetical protein [Candidatus Lokiarchaeota archaeon]MBD3340350.1 hypothetical protein [Candidatus Lokiarchaeota archaeon]
MSVFIDTELWIFALKIPEKSNFKEEAEYESAIERYNFAFEFLRQKLSTSKILMTNFQICELFHGLAFRGAKLPIDYVQKYCALLISSDFMRWYTVKKEDINRAMELSNNNKIHIWDYLCVLPLYNDADILYSCDEHFKDNSFKSLGKPIENPIKEWIIF